MRPAARFTWAWLSTTWVLAAACAYDPASLPPHHCHDPGPQPEICNGIDDDCDGVIDNGCDDDSDGFCDAGMEVIGSPAICPLSASGTGDDCDDADAGTHPAAVESCDGDDNACTGSVPADEMDDDGDGFVECADWVGTDVAVTGGGDCDDADANNWTACAACADVDQDGTYAGCDAYVTLCGPDCDDGDASRAPGAAELCDGIDNACAGSVPAGETDDDGDSFVECADWVGTDVAVIGGGDCDDNDAGVHPGVPGESCHDGIDNDCDGLVDLEDVTACPPIAVSIWRSADPERISHGASWSLWADIGPADPSLAAPYTWSRAWAVVDAQPATRCAVLDLLLDGQSDWAEGTGIQLLLPGSAEKMDCVYTVEVTVNGYATDSVRVAMVNRPPVISSVINAQFDGTAWRLRAAAGAPLTLTASAWDEDGDSPLHFDWAGADVAQLACSPDCAGIAAGSSTVTWASATAPGTYELEVLAWDDFDPASPSRVPVIVEVESCVWVLAGGTGSGATGGTLADPLGSIGAALLQAAAAPGTSACIIGDGSFIEAALIVPVAPNAPDLLGGFDTSGLPAGLWPTITVSTAAGLSFAPGYTGVVHHVSLAQPAAGATTVTITDASPELSSCKVILASGTGSVGVAIGSSAGATEVTAPTLRGGSITGDSTTALHNGTGVRVDNNSGGSVVARILDMEQIALWSCAGTCRGVHLRPGTSAQIRGNWSIDVSSVDGIAMAVDLAGSAAAPVEDVIIEGNQTIQASSQGSRAVSINLQHTRRVVIAGNERIGMWSHAGTELGVGIADGYVLRSGAVAPGGSGMLTIRDNRSISGGLSWGVVDCVDATHTGEGADVAAGILLVGTATASITGNGRPSDLMAGIFGGGSTVHWDPSRRRVPPSAVGLWLLDTTDVTVAGNELRGGSYASFESCALPGGESPSPRIPVSVAYRDGLPPNEYVTSGAAAGERASRNTRFIKNGASCAQMPENGAMGAGLVTWCAAVELDAPVTGSAPWLANNHLAATKGNVLVALWQRGGGGVSAVNNTFDADLVAEPWELTGVPPASIRKWAVLADRIEPGGLALVNNIFYVHADDPYDDPSEHLAIKELTTSGASSSIARLEHNLFWIQGDDPRDTGEPVYARVTDQTTVAEYAALALDAIAGIAAAGASLVALPGLSEPLHDWQKSLARLRPGSAAIDAGLDAELVPDDDIDGELRPEVTGGAVDIGHDEARP